MKFKFVIALLLSMLSAPAFAEPPALPLPWVKLSEIYYTPSQVRMYGSGGSTINCGGAPCNAVYIQTHLPSGQNEGPQPTNCLDPPACLSWGSNPVTVDLVPFGVGEDAKMAWLAGIAIITHGTTVETAAAYITFAPDGAAIDCTRYIGQVVEAMVGGGQRSPMTYLVPLNAGKFQFCYYVSTPGAWPNNSSYGINLSLQAWGR